MSEFVCVGYVCSECGAVLLELFQLTGVRVDMLVWRVAPEGVKDCLDVYALRFGNNQTGPDVWD